MFRGLAARINYLSQDRMDLQFANKAVSKFMSAPTDLGWKILKRVGRYLVGARRTVQKFRWGKPKGS